MTKEKRKAGYYWYRQGAKWDVAKWHEKSQQFKRHNGTWFYEWMADEVNEQRMESC